MEQEEDDEPASLFFASTQIQSRHEDLEKTEQTLGKLQKFKNDSPPHKKINVTMQKPPRKPRAKKAEIKKKKASTSSLSLNAFVKETFRNKQKPDPLSILDYFAGDSQKVDQFLSKIEDVARKDGDSKQEIRPSIHSKEEWEGVLRSIRLRFPNLSTRNQRTLSKISQQLKSLQRSDSESITELPSVWSQASRQPSDSLTTEDMKWLYDLDNAERIKDLDASDLHLNEEEEEEKPFYLTLSQAMDQSKVKDSENEGDESIQIIDAKSPILISDSESEPEPYIPPNNIAEADDIPSHQVAGPPESVDLLTSIAFNSKCQREDMPVGTQTQPLVVEEAVLPKENDESIIFSSPVKPVLTKKPKTPTKWPSNLVITSSPVSSGKEDLTKKGEEEEVFATARSVPDETQGSQSPTLQSSMPLPKRKISRKRSFKTSTLEYWGHVEIPENLSNTIKMRKIPTTSEGDQIPDSEESDCEVSLIEISKPSDPIEPPKPLKNPSILQVPSSPRLSTQSDSFLKLSLLPMKDVREIYLHLGLAPAKLKATMVAAIEYATELTGISIDDLLNNDTELKARLLGKQFMSMLYDKMTNLIKMSDDLHLKIALFEPINIEAVAQHLKDEDVFPIEIDIPFLQKYCDEKGVSTTNRPI